VDNDLEFSVAIQTKDCTEVVRVVWLVVALAAAEASYLKDAPAQHGALKTFTCFEPKTEKGSQQRQQVRLCVVVGLCLFQWKAMTVLISSICHKSILLLRKLNIPY
jgi:hypothetical protein